jgi:hypothetical protein
MTLTLELSDLRNANGEALAQLSGSTDERLDQNLAEIESFLLSLYRIAVLAVRSEHQIDRAADVWRETLAVIDSATPQVQEVATEHETAGIVLNRILELRSAASDMLDLYT